VTWRRALLKPGKFGARSFIPAAAALPQNAPAPPGSVGSVRGSANSGSRGARPPTGAAKAGDWPGIFQTALRAPIDREDFAVGPSVSSTSERRHRTMGAPRRIPTGSCRAPDRRLAVDRQPTKFKPPLCQGGASVDFLVRGPGAGRPTTDWQGFRLWSEPAACLPTAWASSRMTSVANGRAGRRGGRLLARLRGAVHRRGRLAEPRSDRVSGPVPTQRKDYKARVEQVATGEDAQAADSGLGQVESLISRRVRASPAAGAPPTIRPAR